MSKVVIGLVDCPECKFADAEVKEDKNGRAYRYCPDCSAQFFTRDEAADKRLRQNMRPNVKVKATAAPPAEPAPAAGAKKPKAFDLNDLNAPK